MASSEAGSPLSPVSPSEVNRADFDQVTLDQHIEWGGGTWKDQVRRGLQWLGPVRGLRILDVGTRFGGMANLFARMGASVVGVDIDEDALALAEERATAAAVADRIRFERRSGNPDDLPHGFDVVFAKSVLVLSANLGATVAGLHRATTDGGRLLVIENARGPWPVHVARILRRGSLRPYGARYFDRSSVETISSHFDVKLERWTTVPPTVLIGAVKR